MDNYLITYIIKQGNFKQDKQDKQCKKIKNYIKTNNELINKINNITKF